MTARKIARLLLLGHLAIIFSTLVLMYCYYCVWCRQPLLRLIPVISFWVLDLFLTMPIFEKVASKDVHYPEIIMGSILSFGFVILLFCWLVGFDLYVSAATYGLFCADCLLLVMLKMELDDF